MSKDTAMIILKDERDNPEEQFLKTPLQKK